MITWRNGLERERRDVNRTTRHAPTDALGKGDDDQAVSKRSVRLMQ